MDKQKIKTGIYDPKLEHLIAKKDAELKNTAKATGRHFAKRNLPAPGEVNLDPYTGEFKSGYEELNALVHQRLQPEAHFPEGTMEAVRMKEKDRELTVDISKAREENINARFELEKHKPAGVLARIGADILVLLLICIGEVVFNTSAFQLMGVSMLFAFMLSVALSAGVFAFAHIVPSLYKKAETGKERLAVVIGSLVLIGAVFTALAELRSGYLEKHDIHTSSFYFIVFNLFLFTVSALMLYFFRPSREKAEENRQHFKLKGEIRARERRIERMKQEQERNKIELEKSLKHRIRISFYTKYLRERIEKMYRECAEQFKSANLAYRTDYRVPACFSSPARPLENVNQIVNR